MITFIHCTEDELARTISTSLIDRFVSEGQIDWLREIWTPPMVDHVRRYVDLRGNPGHSTRSDIKKLGNDLGIRVHPRVAGYAAVGYKCVQIAKAHTADLIGGNMALLLSFDSDGNEAKLCCRQGTEIANKEDMALDVIIAEANPEFDAWVIAGFAPETNQEKLEHQRICTELRFDPVLHPDQLTSTTSGDKDAKNICARLLGLSGQAKSSDPRVQKCILDASLSTLEANGATAGIRGFFDDLRGVLLPALGVQST